MKFEIECDFCDAKIYRYPSQLKTHNFCSRECLAKYSNKTENPDKYAELRSFEKNSKRMSEMNRLLNPCRMTFSTRAKLSVKRRGGADIKSYPKVFGRHLHRSVAERKLGRKLKSGEVVHHIDGNKTNNNPDNLMVFADQAEHAKWHAVRKGGGAI